MNFLVIDQELAQPNHLQYRLDHGILVPLSYLQQAGLPTIPVLAISIGYLPLLELYAFGGIIRDAAAALGKRVAIVASGDMSHYLKSEGPYEYNPDGARFDASVRQLLARGDVLSFGTYPRKTCEITRANVATARWLLCLALWMD